MKLSEALRLIASLADCYPNATITKQSLEAFARRLIDLPFEVAHAAVEACIAEGRFMPTIAEIRAKASELLDDAPAADEAWGEVQRAIMRHGTYGKPEFSHARIQAIVRRMGWLALCQSENDSTDRAHFVRYYEAETGRIRREVQVDRMLLSIGAMDGAQLRATVTLAPAEELPMLAGGSHE
jgi:hypothetical protein